MRADEQRLRVIVADNANAAISTEFWQISFEFRPEVVVFDVMNGSVKPGRAVYREATSSGSEVGMVICSVKQITHTVIL
jgi:hypothetical protein